MADDEVRSHVAVRSGGPNDATLIGASLGIVPWELAVHAWRALVPELGAVPAPDAVAGSYRLWWRGPEDDLGSRDLSGAPGSSAVVGRHGRADVRLETDPSISLRHVLVLPAPGPQRPALRLVHLRAGLPMFLADAQPHLSLLVQGPFAVRLGRYVLGGFPIGPGEPPPPPEPPQIVPIEDAPAAGRAGAKATRISEMPGPITMVDGMGVVRGKGTTALLTGSRQGACSQLEIDPALLSAGILVGRADRCDPAFASLVTPLVSRIHAAILEVGGRPWLFDCGSSNGTWQGRRRIRSAELGPESAVFLAADGVELRWTEVPR